MTKRIFISFAFEDKYARDFLKGQAENNESPFDFVDMSIMEPFDEKWKTKCRVRIKSCDGAVALISKHTRFADGAKWEMNCANEEDVPMLGVHIHADDKGQVPSQLDDHKVIEWSWNGIARFIEEL